MWELEAIGVQPEKSLFGGGTCLLRMKKKKKRDNPWKHQSANKNGFCSDL